MNFRETKKGIEELKNFLHYYEHRKSLYDCYKTCSQAKVKAYEWCLKKYQKGELNTGFTIGGYNTMTFSVYWIYPGNNGNVFVHKETAYNSYDYFISAETFSTLSVKPIERFNRWLSLWT